MKRLTFTVDVEEGTNARGHFIRATVRRSDKPEQAASIEKSFEGEDEAMTPEGFRIATRHRLFTTVADAMQDAFKDTCQPSYNSP